MADGIKLDASLQAEIRDEIKRANAFFVPALIVQAPDLPRTPNNKLAKLTVKRILHGQEPGNVSALANPGCLEFFAGQGLVKMLDEGS